MATDQQQLVDELAALQRQQPLDTLGGEAVVRNWQQLTPAVADMLQLSRSMLIILGFIVVSYNFV